MECLKRFRKTIRELSKYDYILFVIFTTILLFSSYSSLAKTIILSLGLFIGLIIMQAFKLNFEEKLIFLIAFTLPLNLIMISGTEIIEIKLAGASNYFVFTFFDLLVLTAFIYFVYTKGIKEKIKENYMYLILPIGYLIINIISSIFAIDKTASFYEIIRLIKGIILFLCMVFYFSENLYILFVRGIGLSICGQLIIGIMQIIKGGPLGLRFIGESNAVFRQGVVGFEKGMSGTMAHPGTLALYSIFTLAILIFVTKDYVKEKNIYIAASILTTLLSFARTSIVLMCMVIFFAIMYYIISKRSSRNNKKAMSSYFKEFKLNKKNITVGIIILGLIIAGAFVFRSPMAALVNRFIGSDMEFQAGGRNWHTELALREYRNREHFAFGANNYTYVMKERHIDKYNEGIFQYVQPVHNLYVLYLVELGLIGVLVYIMLYGQLVIRVLRIRKFKSNNMKSIILSTGVWALAVMIYNLTGWSAAKDYFMNIMWIVIGMNVFVFSSLNRRRHMRILLTGYYGAGNFGDDIMLEAICKKILSQNKNVKITILKLFEKKIEVDLPKSVRIINFSNIIGKFKRTLLKLIFMRNDMFLWGGGTCFTDEDGDGLYDYMKLAKERGLKIGYLGVGVGNLTKKERIEKTEYLMKNLDFISLRDERSFEYCKDHVPNWHKKVFLGEDLAYLYFENEDFSKLSNSDKGDKTLLISWRNLINYRSEEEEIVLIKGLVEFVKELIKTENYKVKVVPLDDRKDIPKCEYIYNELKSNYAENVEIIKDLTPSQKVELLKECDLNISGRLHGIFVSEIMGIKTIGLSYSVKIEEFLKSINKEFDYLNVDNITKELLLEKYDQCRGRINTDLIKENIKKSNNNIMEFSKFISVFK